MALALALTRAGTLALTLPLTLPLTLTLTLTLALTRLRMLSSTATPYLLRGFTVGGAAPCRDQAREARAGRGALAWA